MPYINTIDVNGEIYNLGNLTNGYHIVDLPEDLKKDDIFILQGDVVDTLEDSQHNKPLSAYQGRVLNEKIDVESQNFTEKSDTITENLNNEISRSTNKDDELDAKIDAEVERAKSVESTLNINLSAETIRATNEENTLASGLSDETKRAKGKEDALDTKIDSEISRSKKAEEDLSASLSKESTRAQSAEDTLTQNLNGEITRAKGAENTLTTALADEVTRATNKETELSESIVTLKSTIESNKSASDTGVSGLRTYVDTTFIEKDKIIDNLSTDSSENVLSAKQGKVLDEKKFNSTGGTISGDVVINGGLTIGNNTHGISMSKVPSVDSDVTNKKYVDDAIASNVPTDIKDGSVTKAKLADDALEYIDDCMNLTEDTNRSYIKMRNGVAVLWGNFSLTVTMNADSDAGVGIKVNYPEGLFVSSPMLTYRAYGDFEFYAYNMADGNIGIHRIGEAVTNVTITIDYMAIGKWK